MIYGCIGEKLPHSFSREIHALIGDYPYALQEIAPAELEDFMARRPFRGINVTIPYKQAVIPYLAGLSDTARAIGAVNTVINRGDGLQGYNTDFDGLTHLIRRMGLALAGKKVLILGTGGTGKTAYHAVKALGAGQALFVSRTGRAGALTYREAAEKHADADVILNATPCGMYPAIRDCPLALAAFPRLSGVVDVIYNPLRSRLVLEARARGVPSEGGLYMLAAQAVRAAELFQDTQYPEALTEEIYRRILRQKENIVLIGMPGSGKSTVAGILGRRLARPVIDTDQWIAQQAGMPVPGVIRQFGEARFRALETQALADIAPRSGVVIATGGGAVLRPDNVALLRQNGRLFFLDRPLDALRPAEDRPLSDTREKLARLYRERLPVYRQAADEIIPVRGSAEETAGDIEGR